MQASSLRRQAADRRISGEERSARRRGFTLVEMLIAMALTLIMVYAIAEFYAYVGDTVRDGRAMIEMGGQLRAASQRLKRDLDSVSVRVVPWTDDGANSGYFEYFEGPHSDRYPLRALNSSGVVVAGTAIEDETGGVPTFNASNGTNLIGDGDDILAFTIRSGAEPFQGRRFEPGVTDTFASSRYAEVIWWTGFKDVDGDSTYDADEPRYLFRRQLIILPNLGFVYDKEYETYDLARAGLVDDYYPENDVAAKIVACPSSADPMKTVYRFSAVALHELTRRDNRFGHLATGALDLTAGSLNPEFWLLSGSREGEDVMLSNLLAFDVKAYDPHVPMRADSSSTVALTPDDIGYYDSSTPTTVVSRGAYMDLNWDKSDTQFGPDADWTTYTGNAATDDQSHFSPPPHDDAGSIGNTYDTWALSYERQNGQAMDGIDNNPNDADNGGVDDPSERVTSPPYPYPLRGVQVKIRIYDPTSRQVRQATVVADFVAE